MTRLTKTILLACLVLTGPSCLEVEAWELSPDFQFGVAGDGHLSEVLERIRKGNNLPAFAPNGRAHASLRDVALFASAHLAGEHGHAGLLSVESFRKLHTPNADGTAMGWGVSTRDWTKGRWLYHAGSNGRWYACLTLAPDVDFAVFAACNASRKSGDPACDQAAWALIQRYPVTKTRHE